MHEKCLAFIHLAIFFITEKDSCYILSLHQTLILTYPLLPQTISFTARLARSTIPNAIEGVVCYIDIFPPLGTFRIHAS